MRWSVGNLRRDRPKTRNGDARNGDAMTPARLKRLRCKSRAWSAALMISLSLTNSLAATAFACRENAMVVFDASGSMGLFRDGRPKMDIAREAAASVLPDVTGYRPTGLVTYSGERGPACTDVVLRVKPAVATAPRILAALARLHPNGATPLSDAVELAADTLLRLQAPGMIVLVTDGLENCGQNACRLAQRMKGHGDNLRVHVITFFLHGKAVDTVRCLADATGGTYASTASLATLRDALRAVLSCNRLSMLDIARHSNRRTMP